MVSKLVSVFGVGFVCVMGVGSVSVGEKRVVVVDCQRMGGVECFTTSVSPVAVVEHASEGITTRKEEDDSRVYLDAFGVEFRTTETEGGEEKEGESQEEQDNLVQNPLPPSKRRRWGISFALMSLFGLGWLLWVYRHSLTLPTHRLPHWNVSLPFTLPHFSFSMPTISSSSFTLRKPSFGSAPDSKYIPSSSSSSSRFRPDSTSLLQWSEEADPSITNNRHSSRSAQTSSWRNKLPRIPRPGRYSRSGPITSSTKRSGGLFLGELQDEEEDYEEVGLLPSPSPYLSARSERMMSYGTV